MGVIGIILLVILVLSAVLLVLVVLVQDEQGEGVGGIFGGGSSTAFGSRSGNVLTRFTAGLAAVFLICCFGLAWINRTPSAGNVLGKARQSALGTTTEQSWYLPNASATTPGSTSSTPAAGGTPQPSSTAAGGQ
jgi:preprotein translocase subunit SecG